MLEAAPVRRALLLPIAAESPKALRPRLLALLDIASRIQTWEASAALCRAAAERNANGPVRCDHRALGRRAPGGARRILCRIADRSRAKAPVAAEAPARPQLVFVCPGQGGQWLGMVRSLLSEHRVFRAEESRPATPSSPSARTTRSTASSWRARRARAALSRIDVKHLVVFGVQVALAALWQSWGIEPDRVVGHSMGEVSAAYLAGILDLEDAIHVLVERGRILRENEATSHGAMLVVSHPESAEREALAECAAVPEGENLSIAAFNSPQ